MDFNSLINPSSLYLYSHTNESILKKQPIGVLLVFRGLGDGTLINGFTDVDYEMSYNDILTVYPYIDPWCWMNDVTVKTVDALVGAVLDKFGHHMIVGVSGGSMGGLGALIYTIRSKYKISLCEANCPCCDIVEEHDDKPVRPDVPRTLLAAFGHYDIDMTEAKRSVSAIYHIDEFPYIPYYIVHGMCDTAVYKHRQSDVFVKLMREKGHNVIYREVEKMGHCNMPLDERRRYDKFVIDTMKSLEGARI